MSAKKATKKKVAKKASAKTAEGADTEGSPTKNETEEVNKSSLIPTSSTDVLDHAGESEENGRNDRESHPPLQWPDRSQVVSLAVQLVAAQLSGESDDKSRKSIPTLDDASYDELFRGAIFRIEKLLLGPAADTTVVFAEQLFSDTAALISTETIRETFIEWEWPDLLGRKSVVKLMEKIETQLFLHLEQMETDLVSLYGIYGLAEREFIRSISDFCQRRTGSIMHGPLPQPIECLLEDIRLRVLEHYRERAMSGDGRNLEFYEHAWHSELVKWCLGDRNPKNPDLDKGNGEIKYYRPWSLFRYLRIFGGKSEEFVDLQQKLQVRRNQLTRVTTLRPFHESYPSDFPLFNEMFDSKMPE